jgi:hypothetical protein
VDKADFSSVKQISKKYDAHAKDFGIDGSRNGTTMNQFPDAMKAHMTAPGTKIFRFNYRNQGTAVAFIDPATRKMVMVRTDGTFWSAWKLTDQQFTDAIGGFLWG